MSKRKIIVTVASSKKAKKRLAKRIVDRYEEDSWIRHACEEIAKKARRG